MTRPSTAAPARCTSWEGAPSITPKPRAVRRAAAGLLAGAGLWALAAGCSRPDSPGNQVRAADGVRVDINLTSQPSTTGPARIEVLIHDAAGRPLQATAVELEANMSHAGMSPSFAAARLEQPGRWLADLELTMAGDWVVRVDARLADGRAIQREIELPGVEPR